MSVELRPLGVKCNIQCQYCYQNPQRDAGNVLHDFDLERMKSAVEAEGGPFTIFGGEPLMVPEEILEDLWAWGLEKYHGNGIQTNGTLINESHIRMFKTYKVHVGVSVDGPAELNDVRWVGSVERTREHTEKTHTAIERLCKEDVRVSLIVTLHRGNATADKLPVMHDWFRYLDGIGLTGARLHALEVEDASVGAKYALSPEENLKAFLSFHELDKELSTLSLDIFTDMKNLLLGEDRSATCVWAACDPYTTRAVRGVEGNGQRSNCGRTNKDGIDFVKSDSEGFERYLALYHTPQEHGGCKDCRFFLMCKGQCPGTAIAGDWRNRTEHCELWMTLFRHLEEDMLNEGQLPLSVRKERRDVERLFLESWSAGRPISLYGALQQLAQSSAQSDTRKRADSTWQGGHGDHTDAGGIGPRVQ